MHGPHSPLSRYYSIVIRRTPEFSSQAHVTLPKAKHKSDIPNLFHVTWCLLTRLNFPRAHFCPQVNEANVLWPPSLINSARGPQTPGLLVLTTRKFDAPPWLKKTAMIGFPSCRRRTGIYLLVCRWCRTIGLLFSNDVQWLVDFASMMYNDGLAVTSMMYHDWLALPSMMYND
jgi:hypothetical protein